MRQASHLHGHSKSDSPVQSVAIVGGGLAGIAAALALADAGFSVELYESKSRLGGRVGSFKDHETDSEFDYCQHVGMACCTNLQYLINRLNLNEQWLTEKKLHFFDSSGRHLPLSAWPLPAPLHMTGLLLRWPSLSGIERLRIAQAITQMICQAEQTNSSDRLAIDWLRQNRQSEHSIQTFWNTIIVSALGETIDRVGLIPVRKVLLDGFAMNRQAYHLLVPLSPLSTMFNEHAKEQLNLAGVQVHLNHDVRKIVYVNQQPNLCVGQRLEPTQFDGVIAAVPWHKIETLLDEPMFNATEQPHKLQSSPITGVHTWWDRPWMDFPHAALVNRMCQWVFAKRVRATEINRDDASQFSMTDLHYYQIVISSSRDFQLRNSVEIEAALQEDLKSIFPSIQSARLLKCRVVTDPRSVFSISPDSQPRRWSSERFAERSVWLAGDWTETGWPATMEGAIRSGFEAAKKLAAHSGKAINLPVAGLTPGFIPRTIRRIGWGIYRKRVES